MYVERYRRLRDLREDHDLTQAQVGDAINITQRAYSYYESGQHIIPPEVLLRLADLYGVSVDYLLGRDETPAAQPPRGGSGRLQLAALRREHGMTQAQAAALLGCSASLYAKYELWRSSWRIFTASPWTGWPDGSKRCAEAPAADHNRP